MIKNGPIQRGLACIQTIEENHIISFWQLSRQISESLLMVDEPF